MKYANGNNSDYYNSNNKRGDGLYFEKSGNGYWERYSNMEGNGKGNGECISIHHNYPYALIQYWKLNF